jgi:hypothetical protein
MALRSLVTRIQILSNWLIDPRQPVNVELLSEERLVSARYDRSMPLPVNLLLTNSLRQR